MTATDHDADIPTLTDLVRPGSQSKPVPARTPAKSQLDILLDAPEGRAPAQTADEAAVDDDIFAEAIRETEAWFGRDQRTETAPPSAHPTPDALALLDALEPRIEALVDEALSRQVREARDEIVGRVMATLREELIGTDN